MQNHQVTQNDNENIQLTQSELDNDVRKLYEKHGYQKMNESFKKLNVTSNQDEEDKNSASEEKYESILDPNNFQLTTFPIKYQNIWELYKLQVACFWKAEEIDFSNDCQDFNTMNKEEQHFFEWILAFFAASDGIINWNLSEGIVKYVQIAEIITLYNFQTMMENIHSEVYSQMLDNIVKDAERNKYLFNAIANVDSIQRMYEWAVKWTKTKKDFAYKVVGNAIVEGVFFSGAFAAIFWLKHYKANSSTTGKPFMEGLTKSNKFISRDEGLHCKAGAEVYSLLENKLSQNEVDNMMREGVQVATDFILDALPDGLVGMNSNLMSDYIEYIGDRLMRMLGYKKIFHKKNPFKFMENIGLNDKTNFFESRPHEYQDAHIKNKGSTNINFTTSFDNINDSF